MGWQFLSLTQRLDIDKSQFDCGNEKINSFLRNSAIACEREGISKIFLMLSEEQHLVGYYTLGASIIPLGEIPNRYKRGLPNFPFPAVLIGQFGIDRQWQGEGLSYLLLADLYRRIVLAYRQNIIAFKVIRVDTEKDNSKAQEFWRKQGFISFKKSLNSLFLPIQTILNEFE